MKFEHTWTGGWENAIRGLRHPMESYKYADSWFGMGFEPDELWDIAELYVKKEYPGLNEEEDEQTFVDKTNEKQRWLYQESLLGFDEKELIGEYAVLGPKDLDLAQRMIKAGTPNDKFLRQIFISVDITAPLYLWKELDQYKVGTVTDSTSTMHKLASTPITRDCFEMDDYNGSLKMYDREPYNIDDYVDDMWDSVISYCETLRKRYLETKDQRYWKELIRLLPESWLQTRTWTANYAVLRNIVKWRKNHRLKYEWDSFIQWCQMLPYSSELIFYENGYKNEYKLHNLLSSK